MKKLNKVLATGVAAIIAVAGLTACSDDNGSDAAGAGTAAEAPANGDAAEAPADVDVKQDLLDARDVVAENLEWGDQAWEQIMLADDVPSPEMKYGLLVVPFFPSDLVERHTRTVSISDGGFTIDITSAETGLTWRIDQDGNITEGA